METDDDYSRKEKSDEEPSWDDIMYHDEEQKEYDLELTDYLALGIAALQTIFFPLVILIVFLLVLGLAFAWFF